MAIQTFHGDYLDGVFNPGKSKLIKREIKRVLRTKKWATDFIVGRGVSGIALSAIIADDLNKRLCIVRKPGDGTHSVYRSVEGFGCNEKKVFKYVIIDDLLCTGDTMKEIHKAICRVNNDKHSGAFTLECTGVILYRSSWEVLDVKKYCPWANNVHIFDEMNLT